MFSKAVLVAVILSTTTLAYAGETPIYQPVPSWVTPAPPLNSASLTNSSPAFIQLDQQIRFEDGQTWLYSDNAFRATSSEMLQQLGNINLPWHPGKGDLIIHRVEIIRGTETIDLLAKGSIFKVLQREQMLEQRYLTGILTATMSAEGLRIDDILRITYTVTRKDPALSGKMENSAILAADPMRIHFGRIRVIWPEKANFKWKTYGEMPAVKPTKHGGFQEITIAMPLAKQPEMPGDAPARFNHPPIVEFSNFANWPDVSKTAVGLYNTDNLIIVGSPLDAEVTKIRTATSDPLQRTAMALRLVQDQIRYLFKGMDDGNYTPQTPANTWEVRYGDCKAKTLLLLSLLRALDIKAEAILANSQQGDWLPDRIPSFGAFDHILVHAIVNGKSYWLDGTGSGTRIEDIGDAPAFRFVLPLRAEGAELLAVPTHANARPQISIAMDIDQSAGLNFPPPYKISITMRGEGANSIRLAAAQMGNKQIRELVANAVDGYNNNGTVTSHKISFDEQSGTAHIEASGLSNFHWAKESDQYQAGFDRYGDAGSFDVDRNRPAWQNIPIKTDFPMHVAVKLRMKLPENGDGFVMEGQQSFSDVLAGANMTRIGQLDKGIITIASTYASVDSEIAADQIAETRARFGALQANALKVLAPKSYPAPWQEVVAAKAAKRLDPILAAFQAMINLEPKETYPYKNRANFYANIYEFRKAVADVDQIINLQPDTDTYLWRARLFTILGDKKRALADILTARKLDPGSDAALAQLIGYYSDEGQSDMALTLVDDRINLGGPEKYNFMSQKASILGAIGRVPEAIALMDKAITASPGKPNLLNERCWLKGTRNVALDTALKDCTKSIELAESPAQALDSRAMVYYRMGKFDDALSDLEAAYAINQKIPAILYMRGIIKAQTGNAAEGAVDVSAARMMSPIIDSEYAKFDIKPK